MAEKPCNLLKNGGGMNEAPFTKVIEVTSPSTADSNVTVYNGLTADMNITNIYGTLKTSAGAVYAINSSLFDTNNYNAVWRRNNTDLGMRVGVSHTNCATRIVIEYTK